MRALGALVLMAAAAPGCGTTVGRYFADRARDLGDCVRIEAGGTLGVGVVVEAAGLVHVGLGGGTQPFWAAAGWRYGTPHAFIGDTPAGARGSAIAAPVRALPSRDAPLALHVRVAGPDPAIHRCWWLLPALLGESAVASGAGLSRAPMWSRRALVDPVVEHAGDATVLDGVRIDTDALRAAHRWNHVHAFDCGVDVYAGVVHVGVGVSPGEILDFVLGWFGLDVAGDDRSRDG